MEMMIGPIVNRSGSYVFDTWTARGGINRGYPYRRIDDAIYARKAAVQSGSSSARVCQTIDEFIKGYGDRRLLAAASGQRWFAAQRIAMG